MNILKCNNIIKAKSSIMMLLLATAPQVALAVNKSDSGLNSFNTWLSTIIPIILGGACLVLAAMYAMGFVGKDMFKQVGGGLIFGGCSSWLISLFF
ncbi:hypothetical protein FZI27_20160 [Cronobacter sakazakii]|nr:hypothetical protein FZI27_20160 [Cronobacter sakazakii]